MLVRYASSAFKHGFSELDIAKVISEPLEARTFKNARRVFIGYAVSGKIIEVFVEIKCDKMNEEYLVFHCNKVMKETIKMLGL